MNKYIVNEGDVNKRLFNFIKEKIGAQFSARDIHFAIDHQRCSVNGSIELHQSTRLKVGSRVEVVLESYSPIIFDKSAVLYEDAHFLIYNKPPYIASPDLVTLIGGHLVHRLDRDTSGALIVAKDTSAQHALEKLFKERQVQKQYLAIVQSVPRERKGIIQKNMCKIAQKEGRVIWGVHSRGVEATTEWKIEKKGSEYALLRCFPLTGRTHQIRVHLSAIGHPIVGDVIYGSKKSELHRKVYRTLLHAERLSFIHPITNVGVTIQAPLPQEFKIFHLE